MTSVNETFDLMSEMVAMLHQDDDVTSMDEITDVYTQLNKRKAKREQQIKSDIMGEHLEMYWIGWLSGDYGVIIGSSSNN